MPVIYPGLVALSCQADPDSWQAFADELLCRLPLAAVQVESWEPWQLLAQSGIPAGQAREIHLKGLVRTVGAIRVWHDQGTISPEQLLELESVSRIAAVILDRAQEFATNHEVLVGTLHDLRSPCRRVGLYAQMLMNNTSTGQDEVEMQRLLHLDIATTERLFTQLKHWISVSAGFEYGGQTRVALDRALWEITNQLASRRVSVVTSRLQDLPVACPEGMLARMFTCLLENALAYCPEPIIIDVSAEPVDTFARIRFEDNGPGIPVEEAEQAFRPYERLAATPAGNGMGLALVRRIAMSHGGWARRVDSEGGLAIEVGLPSFSSHAPSA